MMKILILGATGFLGSTLYRRALEDDSLTVVGTSRSLKNEINLMHVDVTDKPSIVQAIKKSMPDVVIWCLMSMEAEDQLIHVGLKNVLEELESTTKLIFVSTDAVFVEGKGSYKELDPTGLLPKEARLAVYVNAKHEGERYVMNTHPNHVIIRTGPLYGDMNKLDNRTDQIIKNIKDDKPFHAWANVYRSFVNVDDLSNAILELAKNDVTGILHAGPLKKDSYYSFYKKRLEQLGLDSPLFLPKMVSQDESPYLSFDTSLNTEKIHQLLSTTFRII